MEQGEGIFIGWKFSGTHYKKNTITINNEAKDN